MYTHRLSVRGAAPRMKSRFPSNEARFNVENIAEHGNEIDTLSIATNTIDGFSHFNECLTLTMS